MEETEESHKMWRVTTKTVVTLDNLNAKTPGLLLFPTSLSLSLSLLPGAWKNSLSGIFSKSTMELGSLAQRYYIN